LEVEGDPGLVARGDVRERQRLQGQGKLSFFHGAQFSDPNNLFNAGFGGNKWRAIDIRKGDKIDANALKSLLREAVAYNTMHSVPKSKGSRVVGRTP
jgi:hypothetical protein